jgi:ABC-type nitrate/sulfonate/bicarbonate transport system ATPase subunit
MAGEIVAKGVFKSFRGRRGGALPVIGGVDLHLAPGEVVALVGPSGCGKSTLLSVMAGFETADRGTVHIDGERVAGPSRKRVLMPQSPSIFPWMTVSRNLMLVQNGVSEAEKRRRTDEHLQMVGLTDFADAYPWQLSGGMRQRVELARALVVQPEVLFMDEPFGALDALTRLQVRTEVLRILLRNRLTTVLVTHDVEEALHFADRVVILSERPTRVVSVMSVPFPHPRSQFREHLATLKDEILRELGIDTEEVPAPDELPAAEDHGRAYVGKLRILVPPA